ncbi:MAG: ATP-binding protein [Inhella sp.]|uniref:ATP-binding protein n=1 Tax=Inhella sp. TaxID=1921806 RepID=UPI0039188828
MQLFAPNAEVTELEVRVQQAGTQAALPDLLQLAWHMRQRDPDRALRMAEALGGRLAGWDDPQQRASADARLRLLRGELASMRASNADATGLIQGALAQFHALQDPLGVGDAHWAMVNLWRDSGDPERLVQSLESALIAYERGGDEARIQAAQAHLVLELSFQDASMARQRWEQLFGHVQPKSKLAEAYIRQASCTLNILRGQTKRAARDGALSIEAALACGHLLLACRCAWNTAECFRAMGDLTSALELTENAAGWAKKRQAAYEQALVLNEMSLALTDLGRLDEAWAKQRESLALIEPLKDSIHYCTALVTSGQLALRQGRTEEAIAYFEGVEGRIQAHQLAQYVMECHKGLARAHLQAGRWALAHAKLQAGLSVAVSTGNPEWQLQMFCALAELPDEGWQVSDPSEPFLGRLHCIEAALAMAQVLPDVNLPQAFLEFAADAYAEIGHHQKAYELIVQAAQAAERIHAQGASDRAAALRLREETDALHAQAQQLRLQRETEVQRSKTLSEALITLENMGSIGREITRNLDTEAVFTTLHRHVQGLMDAFSYAVFFVDDSLTTRTLVFGIEDGQRIPTMTTPLRPGHASHRCSVENQVVVQNPKPDEVSSLPGTQPTLSILYAPLTVAGRLLGIMSIQSQRSHAYGDREVAIFKSLCAYGAIALANAEAYQALQQAQVTMVLQEKMASLGQLVANVAHEINTPIGAIKSSGQSIAESLVQALYELPELMRSLTPDETPAVLALLHLLQRPVTMLSSREERALVRDVANALEAQGMPDARAHAATLVECRVTTADVPALVPLLSSPRLNDILRVVYNLALAVSNAANINTAVATVSRIVFALKTYARQGRAEEAVPMSLRESLATVLTLYNSKIKHGTELVCQFDSEGRIDGYPDELSQVWTNLIQNALQAMKFSGTLTVSIAAGEGETASHEIVSIADTGCGIPADIQSRIFEPFFTTKPVGEGSGLGLDIVKKIVEKHRGRIWLESAVGVGTTFRVALPAGKD